MSLQTKEINFENPVFKKLLSLKLNVLPKHLKYFVLPVVGDKITLGNVVYQITYVRENPFRFTAEPVAIIDHEENVKELTATDPVETGSEKSDQPQSESPKAA